MSDFDVVVVGSGVAGLSAAIEASDAGSSVLLVESEQILGGSSRLSGGIIMAGGTRHQRAVGIVQDSPDELFHDYMSENHWDVLPSAVRRLVDEIPDALEWLEAKGVTFSEKILPAGDERFPRGHSPIGHGAAVVEALAADVRARDNIDIALNQRVDRLLRDGDRVVGVAVGGDEVTAAAVVLALGGFGANLELYKQHWPSAAGGWTWYLGADSSRGDIFELVEPLDAFIEGTDRGAWILRTNFAKELEAYFPGWLILVNQQGRRFMDEMAPYSITDPIVQRHGNRVFAIFDEAAKRASQPHSTSSSKKVVMPNTTWEDWVEPVIDQMLENGKVVQGRTVEELALALGIPPSNLAGTVARYNEDVAAGEDTLFMKKPEVMRPIATSPIYGAELRMCMVGLTSCGPAVDADARVMDAGTRPIPGLFAAGECVGGVIGKMYFGSGNSMSNSLVFGRVAGQNAAALSRSRTATTAAAAR